jgi:hypothetical protein
MLARNGIQVIWRLLPPRLIGLGIPQSAAALAALADAAEDAWLRAEGNQSLS